MGTLTMKCTPELESDVMRLSRILGATSISSRRPDTLTDYHIVMTVSGPAIPDRTEPTSISVFRHHEVDDKGALLYVSETYSWTPGV